MFEETEEDLRAETTILNILSYAPRSVRYVRRKLEGKDYPPEVIDRAIQKALDVHLLDDRLFAEMWVQSRSGVRGVTVLRNELRKAGIDSDVIEEVLAEEWSEDVSLQALQSLAEKKVRTFPPSLPREKRKQRLAGFLLRKGFPASDVYSTVNQLCSDGDSGG